MLETVELLCQIGAMVDEADRDSYTPLHLLALNGPRSMPAQESAKWEVTHMGCVTALLSAGATVDKAGVNGRTAFWYAVRAGEAHIVEMLLYAGSNFNNIHRDGKRDDQIPKGSNRDVRWWAQLVIEMRQQSDTYVEERRMLEEGSVPA